MVDQNKPISVHVYVTVYTIGLLSAVSAGKFTANCCTDIMPSPGPGYETKTVQCAEGFVLYTCSASFF